MKTLLVFAIGLMVSVSTAFAGGNSEESAQKAASVKSVKKEQLSSPKFKNTNHFERASVAESKVNAVKKANLSSPEFKNSNHFDRANESTAALVVKKNTLKGPEYKNAKPGRN